MKWRSANAPLAYLMGAIRTVGFEGCFCVCVCVVVFSRFLLTNTASLALPLLGQS